MSPERLNPLQRFVHWLFGAPFRDLPPEFGDTVPPELRAFEAEAEEIQHHPQGKVSSTGPHQEQNRPVH